jgi:hypothetical protein
VHRPLSLSLSLFHTHTHTTAAEKRAKELEEELARTKKAAAEKAAVDAQVVILLHNIFDSSLCVNTATPGNVYEKESSLFKKWKLTCSPYWA